MPRSVEISNSTLGVISVSLIFRTSGNMLASYHILYELALSHISTLLEYYYIFLAEEIIKTKL